MIIQLLPEQITAYWEVIKFGVLSVNVMVSEQKTVLYCRNLLKNLLSGKYQCWLVLAEDREIKAIMITRIIEDIGDIRHLFVDVVYGYKASTQAEKEEVGEHLKKFAAQLGCERILAYVVNELGERAARGIGMTHLFKIFSMEIERG